MSETDKSAVTKHNTFSNNAFPYEDIVNLPHPVSKKHDRMSMEARAAQFMPFAALTGYGDAVDETARLTSAKKVLSEEKKSELDEALNKCLQLQNEHPLIEITYFEKDALKEGGRYITITENLLKLETFERKIVLCNNLQISLDNIYNLFFVQ